MSTMRGHNNADAFDAAEKKRLEAALAEAKNEASRAKSEFLSRMSHEIRTPMNAIIGMTNIAKASNDPDKIAYCLDKIDNASKHLLEVINDILDMAKIEANKFELTPKEFEFEKTIVNCINVVNTSAEAKKQSLIANLAPDVPASVIGDEARLSQVIINLLSNAVKFTPEGGTITLNAQKEGESGEGYTLRIEVIDDGIGISEAQQAGLFIPFEQAHGGITRKYGGTGLGLPISKHIVEMMGGGIWVESALGQGSKFSFTVEMKKGVGKIRGEVMDPASRDKSLKPMQSRPNYDFSGHTILLAEDVDVNREIISAILEDTGVAIDAAENGVEAVAMFQANPDKYSLIMMDIHMPEMDGLEATRAIRGSGLRQAKGVPIIAMTANVFQEDIENCLAAGMNDHVGKPVDSGDLLGKLTQYISNTHKTSEASGKAPDKENASARLDIEALLPTLDVKAGLGQVMNNKKLYTTLLKNTTGRQTATELACAMKESDHEKTAQTARALRGISTNLGLRTLADIALQIEERAKNGMASETLINALKEAVAAADAAVSVFLADAEF